MCASYGLDGRTFKRKRDRLEAEDALFDQWLAERGGVVKLGTTRGDQGPFSPIFTAWGFEQSWWWLWVSGAPAKFRAYNARDDKLAESKAWSGPFTRRRVIIPASYYFETANVPGVKGRFRFSIPDDPSLLIAGISTPIAGKPVPSSFAMVTRPPTARAGEVHDRMPLVLPESFLDEWLDPDRPGDQGLVDEALAASETVAEQLTYTAA